MALKNINDHSIEKVCTHVVLDEIIDDKFKKLFNLFRVLIDLDASDKVFMNKTFAQKLNLELILLKSSKILKTFDESAAASDSITHYVDIYFKASAVRENVRLTRFYITELSHWPIVLEASWFMKNKANISFEKMIVEIFIAAEQSVFEFSVTSKKSANQTVNAPTKYESILMIFISENGSSIDVNVISAAAFSRLTRKKSHNLEVFSLKNIKKAFNIKSKSDSATMIWEKMKRHLLLFQLKKADKLPSHRLYDHKIKLLSEKESDWDFLYDMFRNELLILQKYFKENFNKEFIRSSSFEYSFPVLFVKKLGEGLRFCVDYRELNAIIKKNRYLMFLVQKTLDRICDSKYFIKIDIMTAFNRLRMNPESEKYTTFRTRFDLFEYLVMLFDLCNAPTFWQNFINDIFREHLNDFCTAYADDILIYNKIKKEHIEHCHWVLNQLKKADFICDIKKCEFCVQKIKYLNLIIIADEIKMNLEKIAAIVEWEIFNSVKEVQAFLKFVNFYRRFIRKFSKIADSLNDFTHKNRAFKWTAKCQKAFDNLKKTFITASIFKHFDSEVENIVEIDVFDERLKGVLFQYDVDDLLHSVAFFFKKMILAECNYEIYDKELLAIIKAFEKWRSELKSFKFSIQVIIDHKNLKYFMFSKLLNRRQTRWSKYLSRFNFKITYRSGKLNNATNSLSRAEARLKKKENKTMWQTILKQNNLHIQVCFLKASILSDDDVSSIDIPNENFNDTDAFSETFIDEKSLKDQFAAACALNEKYQRILKALRTEERTVKKFSLAECTIINDQIQYRVERTVIDSDADFVEYNLNNERLLIFNNDELRLKLIQLAHDTSIADHLEVTKIYEILARNYFWINMMNTVKQFTRNCHICRRGKLFRNKYSEALRPLFVFEVRWSNISIDFVVKFSKSKNLWEVECENMMIIVNKLSKQTHVKSIDELTFERVAQVFYHILWRIHDLSESCVSDKGTQFVNYFWKRLTERLRTRARLSIAYHFEIDDQTEVLNSEIEVYIKIFCAYLQNDWAMWSLFCEFAINNHMFEITGFSPFFVNFGQHSRMGIKPSKDLKGMNLTTRQRRLMKHADEYANKMDAINAKLRTQMTWAQIRQERFANAHRAHGPKYAVEDKVWLNTRNMRIKRSSKKLGNKNDEPFIIKAVHGFHVYELELFTNWTIHSVFHTSLLRLNSNDSLLGQISPEPLSDHIDSENNEYWKIKNILVIEVRANRLKVLVKWTEYERPQWESMKDIVEDAKDLIKQFYENHFTTAGADFWQQYTFTLGSDDLSYVNSNRAFSENII